MPVLKESGREELLRKILTPEKVKELRRLTKNLEDKPDPPTPPPAEKKRKMKKDDPKIKEISCDFLEFGRETKAPIHTEPWKPEYKKP